MKSSELNGINVSDDIIPNIIDEIPILSIAACFAKGKTVIKNANVILVRRSLYGECMLNKKVNNFFQCLLPILEIYTLSIISQITIIFFTPSFHLIPLL